MKQHVKPKRNVINPLPGFGSDVHPFMPLELQPAAHICEQHGIPLWDREKVWKVLNRFKMESPA